MPDQDPSMNPRILEQHVAAAEMAVRPTGVLGDIARQLAAGEITNADDVCNVIMLQKGHGEQPRWKIVEDAQKARGSLYAEYGPRIIMSADAAGIRQAETLPAAQLAQVDTSRAVWVVSGGANKTHAVRADILEQAMSLTMGQEATSDATMFEVHGQRDVPKYRKGKVAEREPDPEYKTIQELAPDFMPDSDTTELECKIAVRKQQGWEIVSDTEGDEAMQSFARIITMRKGNATRVLVQSLAPQVGDPKDDPLAEDNFEAGLTVIDWWLQANTGQGLDGKQVIVGENGQYRTARNLSVKLWAERHDLQTDGLVFGDEAGFVATHMGRELVTAARGAAAYASELVVIHRMQEKITKLRQIRAQQ